MRLSDHGEHPFRSAVGSLIALLEKEKRGGRAFLPWGPLGRAALASLEGGDPRFETLGELDRYVLRCRRCRLGSGRLQAVPGEGNPAAHLLIVGEGPGREEDQQGRPFVGPAGELLTRMLQAIGLDRGEVFMANMIKCRPPGNRNPQPDELEACFPLLKEQIRLVNPRILLALGGFAARGLTGSDRKISELRGRSFSCEGRLVIPTYHPAFLLRSPEFKRPAWEDLKKIRQELDRLKRVA